jgi:nicotinamidase/pyrazinamidase
MSGAVSGDGRAPHYGVGALVSQRDYVDVCSLHVPALVGTTSSFCCVAVPYDERTALLVIDVQNDFAHPDGSLYVQEADEVIDVVNVEVATAAAAGALVVTTQDWHPPVTPHFAKDGGTWPVHCVHDTWGAALHERLRPGKHTVFKGVGGEDGYSGFSMVHPTTGQTTPTGLDDLLRANGIERVVVAGLATDYCVKETVLDALRLGYDTTVLLDGIRPVELEPGDGQRAIDEMAGAGAALA